MMLVIVTFMLTTGLHGLLAWLAFRRVVKHLQGNDAATKAVTDHMLIPLLGRQTEKKG